VRGLVSYYVQSMIGCLRARVRLAGIRMRQQVWAQGHPIFRSFSEGSWVFSVLNP
jgi:hypothetical protein